MCFIIITRSLSPYFTHRFSSISVNLKVIDIFYISSWLEYLSRDHYDHSFDERYACTYAPSSSWWVKRGQGHANDNSNVISLHSDFLVETCYAIISSLPPLFASIRNNHESSLVKRHTTVDFHAFPKNLEWPDTWMAIH